MAGVEYYHIPIRDEESNGNSFFERVMSCYGEGERYIQERYRSLITDEYSLKQYARFLDVLLHVKMEPLFFTVLREKTGQESGRHFCSSHWECQRKQYEGITCGRIHVLRKN